ncbi:MAG TPA: crosslink repair DNA glycosylase YcaQ family protein [Steroidobacteraceae bacterium]|nr:crosslink repair DNA glycosylase YcaQ family protein [Steroidobacteraceae bacterium]
MSQILSIAEARRIALAAQLFVPAPGAPKNAPALGKIVHRLGAVQIDSVNVLVRSHYLPIYSRCGSYAPELLERAAYDGSRSLFEYWGHEASFLPIELYPLFRWRMDRARNGEGTWKRMRRYATSHKDLVSAALEQIRERGALGASELADCGKSKGSWWGWSQGKEIMEWLFWTGEVTTARRRNFERLYDLTERVLPERVRTVSVPSPEEARRELMAVSARALGVATARDLRDYFRLPAGDAALRVAELVEEGTLQPVAVEGWKQQAYLHKDAACPRRAEVSALLSPFDSLIWERQRTERLFDFHFRLEIYTPIHKRLHGYYVLPFLLGDRLVGRVDLKANRQDGRLEVRGGSAEQGVRVSQIVEPLAAELTQLARWLKLEGVAVTSRRGELMRALKKLPSRRASNATASRRGRQPRTV